MCEVDLDVFGNWHLMWHLYKFATNCHLGTFGILWRDAPFRCLTLTKLEAWILRHVLIHKTSQLCLHYQFKVCSKCCTRVLSQFHSLLVNSFILQQKRNLQKPTRAVIVIWWTEGQILLNLIGLSWFYSFYLPFHFISSLETYISRWGWKLGQNHRKPADCTSMNPLKNELNCYIFM